MTERRKFCKAQIGRLGDMAQFPETKPGLSNLVDALERWTVSEAHAEDVIQRVIDEFIFCPSPAQIRSVALGCRPDVRPASCELCRDTPGWIQTTRTIKKGPFAGQL